MKTRSTPIPSSADHRRPRAAALLLALGVATACAAPDPTWQQLSSKRGDLPAPPGGSTQQTGAVVADFDGDLELLNKPYHWVFQGQALRNLS